MAIFYKLQYRNTVNNPKFKGYYATVANKGMVTTDEVADEIQRNCSMKRSDVLAVLAELSEVIKLNVQQSHSVKLEGIGIFRPGISSKLVEKPSMFDPRLHITGLRLNFLPESMTQAGRRIKKMFDNVHLVQESKLQISVAPDAGETGGGSGGGKEESGNAEGPGI